MESWRCYTSHIVWDCPNYPGSGKWTSNSLPPTFVVFGPALRISTAKPTTFTAVCALVRDSVSFLGTTGSVSWYRATPTSHAPTRGVASPLPRHGAPGGSSLLIQGRRWVVVAWKNQREYDGGWSIPGPIFRRPGADQASSPPGALHDLNGGRMRFLVPPGPRSQRVPSGDPT